MAHEIVVVPPTDTIEQLERRLRGKESGGYELVTLGLGVVGAQRAILAAYLRHPDVGDVPPPLVLKDIGPGTVAQQEAEVTKWETEGRLISYAGVVLSGRETNVAVYRTRA